MSIFTRFFSVSTQSAFTPHTGRNIVTENERRRLADTMPGETGARTGSRFGLML